MYTKDQAIYMYSNFVS